MTLNEEIDFLLQKKKVLWSTLSRAIYSEVYATIKTEMNFSSARQTLHYAKTNTIPKCHCGTPLRWKDVDYYTYCSPKCGNKSPVVRQKITQTCEKKYGYATPGQNVEIKKKISRTLTAKPKTKRKPMSAITKHRSVEKRKQTCRERYGVDHISQSELIRAKTEQTNIERYGVKNGAQSSIAKKKQKTLWIEYKTGKKTRKKQAKWTDELKKEATYKRINSSIEKYGVPHPTQTHYSPNVLRVIDDEKKLRDELMHKSMQQLATELGISPYPIYQRMQKWNIKTKFHASSYFEQEVVDFIKCVDPASIVHRNVRTIISPKELDIFMPTSKFAIECHGAFWHSDRIQYPIENHQLKSVLCQQKGVRLFQIWDFEWKNKQDIVQSMIRHKLNASIKLNARKCEVREVSSQHAIEFFDKTHLQGACASSIQLGLYYQNELVMCVSFGKPRFTKKAQWELLRMSNKLNHCVVGGSAKLFKAFQRQYHPSSIISYANRMFSTGEVYRNLGFNYLRTSKPGYFYTNDFLTVHHRTKFQKHKLVKNGADSSKSETEIMTELGYSRIFDAGHDVFLWCVDK